METKRLITKMILELSKLSKKINPTSMITVCLIYLSITLIENSYLYEDFIF